MTIVSERLRSNPSRLDAPSRGAHPKILHVVTRYLRGGSERRIRDIVEAVPEAEHHLVLGGHSDAKLARREIDPVTLRVVPSLVRQPAPLKDLAALARLAGLIGRNRFDLIVTHQAKAGALVRVVALTRPVPVVHSLSMANFGPGYPAWQSRLFRLIETKLERVTTDYVVVGTDLSRRYAEIDEERDVPRDRDPSRSPARALPRKPRCEEERARPASTHAPPFGACGQSSPLSRGGR